METINQIFLYFFQPNPSRSFQYELPLWVYAATLAIMGIYIFIYIRKHKDNKAFKKLFRPYPIKLVTIATLLALYLLSRAYAVPFFSMRFFLFVIIITSFYICYTLGKTYLHQYPEEKKLRQQREESNKYIPRKKHK